MVLIVIIFGSWSVHIMWDQFKISYSLASLGVLNKHTHDHYSYSYWCFISLETLCLLFVSVETLCYGIVDNLKYQKTRPAQPSRPQ